MNEKKPLIVLTGPTAVGKSALSIALAKEVNGEIISADSMQVYKYMDIGTAKISQEEMRGVPHHLIDQYEPAEEFNVVRFQSDAKRYMQEIWNRGKLPVIVGGTGFYIQSVLYDIDFTENPADQNYREELEALAVDKGADYLHELLRSLDPQSADKIHANNVKKTIRAIEYYKQTGQPISEHNEEQRQNESPYNYLYFVLNKSREFLYRDIDKRVDIMFEQGLVSEVKHLMDMGYHKNLVSMQGLGYKETIQYLSGEITLEEAVYIIKRDTRHFAKRQLTWFKRERDVTWVEKEKYLDEREILDYLVTTMKRNGVWI